MLIAAALILIVVPMLAARRADLATLRDRWGTVAAAMAVGILLPMTALLLATALMPEYGDTPPAPQFAAAILIMAAPIGLAAPLLAGLTGGTVMLVRALMLVSAVPLIWVAPMFFGLNVAATVQMLAVLLIPLALALWREDIAARLASPLATLSSVVTLALAGVVVWRSGLAGIGAGLITAVAVLAALALAGRLLGRVLGLGASDRRAVGLGMTTRNLGLPLVVALALDMPQMGVPMVAYGVLMWAAGLAPLAARRA